MRTLDERHAPSRRARLRKIGVSVLVVAVVTIGVLESVPDSPIERAAAPVVTPVARATGLDQGWGVFSPNPPRVVTAVRMHVIMRNGENRVWRFEEDSTPFAYRWRKMKEALIRYPKARPGFARWVINELTSEGERPARVVMIMERTTLPLPGRGSPKRIQSVMLDTRAGGR